MSTGLFSREASFLKKTFFHLYFTFLAETFQVFGKTVPARWPEQHQLLGFCIRLYANFFPSLRKILLCGLSELHSRCPQVCLHGKHVLLKNTFPTILHNLGGLFLGFSQNFSSTLVKTTLASRFLYSGLCQFCSGFTENFIGRSIRTALYKSTVLFSWVASSLGKTLFLLYFTF